MLNLLISSRALRTRFIALPVKLRRTYYTDDEEEIQQKNKIPGQPQKSLFSSLITEEFTPEQSKEMEKEYSLKFNSQKKIHELRPFKKSQDYELTKPEYTKMIEDNPKGKVNVFTYKDTKFTLVGTQFEFVPVKNIYKMMAYTKPSVVVLQTRPDQVLKSIDLNPLNKANKFSNRLYFSQLVHKATAIVPSTAMRDKVYTELLKTGILINDNRDENGVKYKPYEVNERLTLDTITTACLYAEDRGIDVVLGDVPEIVYRQNIANSLTLLQLQQIFTRCSRELALYPDLQPQTPFTMACLLFPEIFVRPSDKYISTLFEYMIHKGHKNIMAFVGFGQSDSIVEYLDKRKVSSLDEELKILPIPQSIIRDVQGEEILEKHALLDVLFHGKDILNKVQNVKFKTTASVIKSYSDPNHVDSTKPEKFKILHYQFLVKYQRFCEQEFEVGKKIMKRQFISKVGI